ncbi:acyl-CoA dehydrogenase family protein [Nocardia vaccinii]|uniref:acyl-CoA dehydrogenase family protein n=1 Tax=Nocardia vaccinii TaxID=1822 RepID=UPI001FE025BD|nr:acyl-CoA dehydrogenase family protein [Nocardia vaccinii]
MDALIALRGEVREFLRESCAAGEWTPAVDGWVGGLSPRFSKMLAARGWVGMTVPLEYGGSAQGALRRFVVTEELLAAGAPVAAHWIADRQIVPSLLNHGTVQQRTRYLPGIAAGELYICLGMSEPDAGSDLAAVRTRATRQADGSWLVSGSKIWTSHAQISHAILVLARTEPPGDKRHAGLSQFLIDLPYEGVTIRPIVTLDGHAHFNEVIFDDVVVPADALLGQEGQGWAQVTAELAYERSGPERIMSTVPLLLTWGAYLRSTPDDVGARLEFARLSATLSTLRAMSFEVACALDAGELPATRAAMVKELGGTFEQEVVEVVSRWTPVEPDFGSDNLFAVQLAQAITHGPTFTIRGGASDVLRGIVAKGLGAR